MTERENFSESVARFELAVDKLGTILGMQAENDQRKAIGASMAYVEAAFFQCVTNGREPMTAEFEAALTAASEEFIQGMGEPVIMPHEEDCEHRHRCNFDPQENEPCPWCRIATLEAERACDKEALRVQHEMLKDLQSERRKDRDAMQAAVESFEAIFRGSVPEPGHKQYLARHMLNERLAEGGEA